jgi:hypothetical protein
MVMTLGNHQRFRVELLVNTRSALMEMMYVKEVVAVGEEAAAEAAIRMLKGEYPSVRWTKIDPWYVERLNS